MPPVKSRYQLKRLGKAPVVLQKKRQPRLCSSCRKRLYGKRGHGFPARSGRQIFCGACKK